jgi:hypothetical protein
MKTLLTHLVQFALVFGISDKEKFRGYALMILDRYPMDEDTREKVIDFAHNFLIDYAARLQQTQVVKTGVRQGVSSLEKQMEDLNEKLEQILQKMPAK